MIKLGIALGAWAWLACGAVGYTTAQTPAARQEKAVAVYISKKGITFSEPYFLPLAAYVQRQDTLGLRGEEMKLALAVKLSNQLQLWLTQTRPGLVLNANTVPELAQAIVAATRTETWQATGPLPSKPLRLMVVEELNLTGETRKLVFTESNRILNERRFVQQGSVRALWIDGTTGALIGTYSYSYDAERSPVPHERIAPGLAETTSERLIRTLINGLLEQLNNAP